jgi:hypothetical protein
LFSGLEKALSALIEPGKLSRALEKVKLSLKSFWSKKLFFMRLILSYGFSYASL